MIFLRYFLLLLLIVCAVTACVGKNLQTAVIKYMSFSLIMAVIWILLKSHDLAITEAAVGAGITSVLYFLTLKNYKSGAHTPSRICCLWGSLMFIKAACFTKTHNKT